MLSLLLSSLILLLILPAICSANELIKEKKVIIYNDTFEGESENWEAKYLLNEKHVFITANRKTHYFGNDKSSLVITYKGNLSGISSPEKFSYSYDAGSNGGSGTLPLDRRDSNYVIRSYSEGGSIKEQKAIFMHTITSICNPYKTVYIYREGWGGVGPSEDNTVKVTMWMAGKREMLELKNINSSVT